MKSVALKRFLMLSMWIATGPLLVRLAVGIYRSVLARVLSVMLMGVVLRVQCRWLFGPGLALCNRICSILLISSE